mmetsp:Transcript_14/g.53  ORF Transcript_14/g.53 Transcript_14/m.53 type:complete len:390 (-) Transcript_14:4129-5298(-)
MPLALEELERGHHKVVDAIRVILDDGEGDRLEHVDVHEVGVVVELRTGEERLEILALHERAQPAEGTLAGLLHGGALVVEVHDQRRQRGADLLEEDVACAAGTKARHGTEELHGGGAQLRVGLLEGGADAVDDVDEDRAHVVVVHQLEDLAQAAHALERDGLVGVLDVRGERVHHGGRELVHRIGAVAGDVAQAAQRRHLELRVHQAGEQRVQQMLQQLAVGVHVVHELGEGERRDQPLARKIALQIGQQELIDLQQLLVVRLGHRRRDARHGAAVGLLLLEQTPVGAHRRRALLLLLALVRLVDHLGVGVLAVARQVALDQLVLRQRDEGAQQLLGLLPRLAHAHAAGGAQPQQHRAAQLRVLVRDHGGQRLLLQDLGERARGAHALV